jgi:Holliday junction resolvasome RuvABC endonuclease subunit
MILTNDPSFSTGWGWAVIDERTERLIDWGASKHPSDKGKKERVTEADARRFRSLAHWLHMMICNYHITTIISETPDGSQSARAAKLSGATMGVLEAISITMDIPLYFVYQGDVKKFIFNKRNVEKGETQEFIVKNYDFNGAMPRSSWAKEAVCDAMAVYHYAKHNLKL